MISLDLKNIEKPLLQDSLTFCFSAFIWRSRFNGLALTKKESDRRHAIILLEINFKNSLKIETEHPGDNTITIEYLAQVRNGWVVLHEENSTISVWKHACLSANFYTGEMWFTNGQVKKNFYLNELKNSKDSLIENWDRSHLWTGSETTSQINVFTSHLDKIKCGDSGDLISWTSPHWQFEKRFPQLARKKTLDEEVVCGKLSTPVLVNVPVKTSFNQAVQVCKLLGDGQVTAYFSLDEWTNAFQKAEEDIKGLVYLWFSIKKINGTFVNFYTGKQVENIIWRPNSPSGLHNCITCQDYGCTDRSCEAKDVAFFQCIFRKRPRLVLRGLCPDSKFSTTYYPDNKLGEFIWIGTDGTFIRYNISSRNWVAKIKLTSATRATSEASFESLLLGTHEWTVYNDWKCFPGSASKVKLNLSFCNKTMFNCEDGGCINLDLRCDENIDCSDGSDEVGCKRLDIPFSYNKEVTSNTKKTDLLTTAEIYNVLSIDENLGKIRITMSLITEWHDSRVTFLNLKANSELNILDDNEFASIWKPKVNFVNIEQKSYEDNFPEQLTIHMNSSKSHQLADYGSLYNSKKYNGSQNIINLNQEFR